MKKIKMFWNLMSGNRNLYLFAILAIGFAIFLRFLWPMVLRATIDNVIGDKPLTDQGWLAPLFNQFFLLLGGKTVLEKMLWICSLLLILLTASRGIFIFLKGKWSAIATESIIKNLREKLYDHLQHLPFSYHVKVRTGDLIQRCTSDIETIRRFLALQFVEIGRALFMIVIALSFMLPMNLKMTLISLSLVPFLFIFSYVFFIKIKVAFKNSDESEGRLSTVLQENLTGVRVVKAFARQKFEIDKFDAKNSEFRDLTFRLIHLFAIYWGFSDMMSLIQIGGVLIFGTLFAAQGEISLGTLLAFSSYSGMLLWPIRQLGRVLTDMGKAMISLERIQEILDEPIEDIEQGTNLTEAKGKIEFKNVWFEYKKKQPVLKNISFKVEPGETVAILGPIGSGKSSLVNLIPRLYDIDQGEILIDDLNINLLSKQSLRQNIGIVLQEPFLFSRTIKENIRMNCQDANEETIFNAAQIASVHDVIETFQDQYETKVGERGVTLSGGQKQRIAIARAIINSVSILIFDDSLSAVDTETDAAIRNRLKKRGEDVTTIIISHRLHTLAEADKIIVLEKGKIVQEGSHLQLLAEEGLYKRIWQLQNSLEEEFNLEEETLSEPVKNQKVVENI